MGYSLSLLAVPAEHRISTLQQLGFTPTGKQCNYADEPLAAYVLPSQWLLIVAQGCDHPILKRAVLEGLSVGFPVLACTIEEHVMFSAAEYWADGRQVWRVAHAAEEGLMHLDTTGTLPPGFDAMAASHRAAQAADGGEQADVDHYFEIPLAVAKDVMGFKHDEDVPGVDYSAFEILNDGRSPGGRKPWWRFW